MRAGNQVEEQRAWIIGATVAGLNMLASLAEGEELADLRASLLSSAAAWAQACEPEALLHALRAPPG